MDRLEAVRSRGRKLFTAFMTLGDPLALRIRLASTSNPASMFWSWASLTRIRSWTDPWSRSRCSEHYRPA